MGGSLTPAAALPPPPCGEGLGVKVRSARKSLYRNPHPTFAGLRPGKQALSRQPPHNGEAGQ